MNTVRRLHGLVARVEVTDALAVAGVVFACVVYALGH
jgi:hypothetical protein